MRAARVLPRRVPQGEAANLRAPAVNWPGSPLVAAAAAAGTPPPSPSGTHPRGIAGCCDGSALCWVLLICPAVKAPLSQPFTPASALTTHNTHHNTKQKTFSQHNTRHNTTTPHHLTPPRCARSTRRRWRRAPRRCCSAARSQSGGGCRRSRAREAAAARRGLARRHPALLVSCALTELSAACLYPLMPALSYCDACKGL